MLIVRRVTVHSWRNVQAGATVHPSAGINLLVGEVATGKSTLLELVTMILRSDFGPIEDELYDIEYEIEYVDLGTSCLMTVRRRSHPGQSAADESGAATDSHARDGAGDGARAETSPSLKLDIQLTVGDRRYLCTFADGQIRMEHDGRVLASHSLQMEDALEPLSWALIAIAGSGEAELMASIGMVGDLLRGHYRTVRLDEGLDVFRAITGAANSACDAASVQLRHPLPPATIARLGSSVPGFASVQLAYQAQVRLKAQPEATTLIVKHDELPMFERLVRLLGVENMRLELTRVSSEALSEATLYRYGHFRFVFQFPGCPDEIDHTQLSYGQKRLLALMYCLDADADHLIADGLPGGLPRVWLSDVLSNLLGDPSASCQVFASYHDPQLLPHLPPEHPPHPLTGARPVVAIACVRMEGGAVAFQLLADELADIRQNGDEALAAYLGAQIGR